MNIGVVLKLGAVGLVGGVVVSSWNRGTGASEKIGQYKEGLDTYGPIDLRRNKNWTQFRYGL